MASTHNLLEFRDSLPAEERSRLEARILQSHEALLAEAQEAAKVAALPLLSLDLIWKREWIKKKTTHGKADARGLTDAEIAGRALKAQENKECAAYKALNTPLPCRAIGAAHRPSSLPSNPHLTTRCAGIARIYGTCATARGAYNRQAQEEIHPGLQRGKAGRITLP